MKYNLKNGEAQTRHLTEMPFAATGMISEAAIAEFGVAMICRELWPEAFGAASQGGTQ